MSFYVYETTAEKKGDVGMTEKVKLTREQAEVVEKFKVAYDIAQKLAKAVVDGYEVDPEYKVEDWVVVTFELHESIYGKTKKITKAKKSYAAGHDVCYELDGGGVVYKNEIRHATPEEIKAEKERRVWVGIGRKVGEFKIGDIYMNRNYIVPFRIEGAVGMKRAKDHLADGKITKFYPAESFISFEEDSND